MGRKEAFEHWYRALLSVRHVGYKKQVFSPQDVVIFNKVWRNKAYLLTNGFSYGTWMQYVKHNPKTGRPDMRKEPIFGQTEAFYTALHQAEYWGLCYFAYFNVDNLRFPIRDYIWSTKLNDPQYYDWVNKEVCIKNWYRYDKNGYKIPSNHVNNYYERYYPQAYAESWGVPWLFGIDTHRLTEYTHPPIAKVVESHALYRALCIKNGWSFDYLDFYPEYFIQTSLEDSESWFYPYGTGSNPSLFNDMFMFAWMLCQPDYEPGPFTARDLDFKLHLHFDLPRYSVSPASAVHDSTGDVLEMYRHLIGN